MEKVIYDEKNGLWYELQGDYYIPCLKLPEEEQLPIGVWGQRHLRYIKQNRKVLYLNLLTSGKLNRYLSDLDKQAEEMFSRLVKPISFHMRRQNNISNQSFRLCLLKKSVDHFHMSLPGLDVYKRQIANGLISRFPMENI